MRLKLSGEQTAQLGKRYTDSIKAYQLYLRGRRNSEKRSSEGFKKGAECLSEAITLDPHYALAYAELAQCIHMPAYYGRVSPHEAYPRARELAQNALSMDDTLAEAHDALATVMQNYDYNWGEAEQEYKRAIQVNPNYTVARLHYAMHLGWLGRLEEAINEAIEGQNRDPMSGIMNAGLAFILSEARRYDWCIEQSLTAIDLDPSVTFTYLGLAAAYEMKGMYYEAIATHEKSLAVGGSAALHAAMIAHVLATMGDYASAREALDELHEISKKRYLPAWSLAIVYEGLGEIQSAIQCLQTALENRDALLVTIKVWPHFDKLRGEPAFRHIQQRVGLPG